MPLKGISYLEFWLPSPVRRSSPIYAILKEGIMGNIHVSYMKFGPVVQKEMLFKEKVYGRTPGRTTEKDQSQ